MKHKTLLINDSYGDKLENTVFNIGNIEIGTNFTLDHVFNFMTNSQFDYISSICRWLDLNGNCRIIGEGLYNKIKVNISAYDLSDLVRYEYNNRPAI